MAIHKSVEKRARQNQKRYLHNKAIKSSMKTRIKGLLTTLEGKNKDTANAELKKTISSISKAASKGIIHKKAASRKISRLTKRVNKQLTA
jgi:small subunit ribosomal protein S20